MEQLSLDKTSFIEISPDVFIQTSDKHLFTNSICRYQNFASFYHLLKGQIYIPMRREFTDLHEHGKNYNPFIAHITVAGEKITPQYEMIWKEEKERKELISYWHTLCFTLDTDDNYFFWKTYTNIHWGIRFKTTIQKFIESINFSGYELYIGKIKYVSDKTEPICYDVNQYVFSKINSYKDEKELRIYFLPKTQENQTLEQTVSLFLKITPEKMIEKLWLSPFMPTIIRSCVRDLFNLINPKIAENIEISRIIEQ